MQPHRATSSEKWASPGDGTEIWFSRQSGPEMAQISMPFIGGTPRDLLDKNATAPAWSPDGTPTRLFQERRR